MQELFELDSVNVSGILDVVMGCGEIASLPDDVQFKVRLCVEEVVENIFSYSKAIRVDVSVTTEELREAFYYTFPLVIMDATKSVETNTEAFVV